MLLRESLCHLTQETKETQEVQETQETQETHETRKTHETQETQKTHEFQKSHETQETQETQKAHETQHYKLIIYHSFWSHSRRTGRTRISGKSVAMGFNGEFPGLPQP